MHHNIPYRTRITYFTLGTAHSHHGHYIRGTGHPYNSPLKARDCREANKSSNPSKYLRKRDFWLSTDSTMAANSLCISIGGSIRLNDFIIAVLRVGWVPAGAVLRKYSVTLFNAFRKKGHSEHCDQICQKLTNRHESRQLFLVSLQTPSSLQS